jgi:hypothetical protein
MSARLKVEPAIDRPDDFYEALIAAHRDLTDAQSLALNCRLILVLANQIGDVDLLKDALALARRSAGAGG